MSHEFWYLSRAAGFTAYLLLFAAAALGIALSTRFAERLARRNLIFDVHRFVSILALAFSIFHVYVLLGDGYFNFNVWQLSFPFLSPYRNWQVAAGVFGVYAMVLVVASFYVRQFVGYRTWRTLHYLTVAMYAAVAVHGIRAGADTTEPWARAIYLVTGAAIVALLFYRLQHLLPETPWVRTARLTTALAAAVIAALLVTRAGLIGPSSNSSASAGSGTAAVFLPSFTDAELNGTFTQTDTGSSSRLTLDGAATGDLPLKLNVDLVSQSSPQPQGASRVTANSARLLDPDSDAVVCDGKLTALNNNVISIAATAPARSAASRWRSQAASTPGTTARSPAPSADRCSDPADLPPHVRCTIESVKPAAPCQLPPLARQTHAAWQSRIGRVAPQRWRQVDRRSRHQHPPDRFRARRTAAEGVPRRTRQDAPRTL